MIKGLSERTKIPRLGKIRLGVKGEKGYPQAVDYFVVNADKSTSEEAAKNFHAVYGDKPKTLDIILVGNDIDKIFPQFYKRHGKTGLMCKGDGEVAHAIDPKTGEIVEGPCKGPECKFAKENKCGPVGSLYVILYKVKGVGVWQLDTGSVNSIIQLNSSLKMIASLTGGRLSGIPMKLIIKPMDVEIKDGNGQRTKKTIYTVDLAFNQSFEEVMAKSAASGALLPDGFFVAGNGSEKPADGTNGASEVSEADMPDPDEEEDDDPFPEGDF